MPDFEPHEWLSLGVMVGGGILVWALVVRAKLRRRWQYLGIVLTATLGIAIFVWPMIAAGEEAVWTILLLAPLFAVFGLLRDEQFRRDIWHRLTGKAPMRNEEFWRRHREALKEEHEADRRRREKERAARQPQAPRDDRGLRD